ncbi:hypothetical protein HDU96_000117 [Phlyctochytrium bullatum]|nr:hypothetical protein HDU96_000117 [Phlyctochytrium bullatum]
MPSETKRKAEDDVKETVENATQDELKKAKLDSPSLHGKCTCGNLNVTLKSADAVNGVSFCHCLSCRRWASAPVAMIFGVKEFDDVQFDGEITERSHDMKDWITHRRRCKTCGCDAGVRLERGGHSSIYLPTTLFLDEDGKLPSALQKPTAHSFYGLHGIDFADDGLPKFTGFANYSEEYKPKEADEKKDAKDQAATKDEGEKPAESSPVEGKCTCGELKIEIKSVESIKGIGFCHCKRWNGAPITEHIEMKDKNDVTFKGDFTERTTFSGEWKTHRRRCKNCGCDAGTRAEFGGVESYYLPAEFFIDGNGQLPLKFPKPSAHSFYKLRVVDLKDDLKKYEGWPHVSPEITA